MIIWYSRNAEVISLTCDFPLSSFATRNAWKVGRDVMQSCGSQSWNALGPEPRGIWGIPLGGSVATFHGATPKKIEMDGLISHGKLPWISNGGPWTPVLETSISHLARVERFRMEEFWMTTALSKSPRYTSIFKFLGQELGTLPARCWGKNIVEFRRKNGGFWYILVQYADHV